MKRKLTITNVFGEKLDTIIEGNSQAKQTVIFVHGFGTDKDEGFASYLDLSQYLANDFLNIRFDLSGYGKSEGEDQSFQFQKAAGDVDSVIRYTKTNYPDKAIFIIAHSLGIFIVSMLSPYGIKKIVFTSIPNSNMEFIIRALRNRIITRGGVINEDGLTRYPRTSGATQYIGKDFWRTLRHFEPLKYIEELSHKTKLIIFKPLKDDVLENKYFNEYKEIPNIEYREVPGDHNFTKQEDRDALFKKILKFFNEK